MVKNPSVQLFEILLKIQAKIVLVGKVLVGRSLYCLDIRKTAKLLGGLRAISLT